MLNRGNLLILILLAFIVCSCESSREYTNQDVVNNYRKKETQIRGLKKFYNSIIPPNKFVEIEFDDSQHLFRFGVYSINPATNELILPGFLNWNLSTNSNNVDSVVATLNWNQQTLKTIKQKLDSANCISIESGEPCKIGFQRQDLGKYNYLVFDKPMSDSLKLFYKNYCAYNLYNDRVVLMWGAGALGGDCYPQ